MTLTLPRDYKNPSAQYYNRRKTGENQENSERKAKIFLCQGYIIAIYI
jgi:hypothetical protein